MARRLLSCCNKLRYACSTDAVCQQLPSIPGLVQPWLASDEPSLKQLLSYTLTKCHNARVVADEWAVSGQTNLGLGDIVAELPCGTHVVIELKYLDVRSSGRTAKARRNRHRSCVAQQAQTYGRLWQEMLQQKGDHRPVFCASFDNEKGLEYHASVLGSGFQADAAAVTPEAAAASNAEHPGAAAATVIAGFSDGAVAGFESSSSSSSGAEADHGRSSSSSNTAQQPRVMYG